LILAKGKCAGTRGKTRTRNLLIRSQALYPLSYAGGHPMVWNAAFPGAPAQARAATAGTYRWWFNPHAAYRIKPTAW
jgi:hypothetical protein